MRLTSIITLLLLVLFVPDTASAQSGFVTCDGTECSACHLAEMGNTIVTWLIGVLFVVFAVIMAIAGWGLVTSAGNPAAKQAAKDKFMNAIIGLIIVLAAWILVDTIMRGLLSSSGGVITGYGFWADVECQTQVTTQVDSAGSGTDGSTPPALGPAGSVVTSPGGDSCFPGPNGVIDGPPAFTPGSDDVCINAVGVSGADYNLPDGSELGYTPPPGYFDASIIAANPQISPNLHLCDVTNCDAARRQGDYVYIDPFMVAQLDNVYDDLGGLSVNSGYRSPAYNEGVGGATHSRHQYGDAVDIAVTASNPESDIIASCRNRGATNIYTYDSGAHVHCDWRGAERP